MMWLVTLACVFWRTEELSPREQALLSADAHYQARAEGDELETAIEAYRAILAEGPADRAILSRLSRAYGARGLVRQEEPGLLDLEVARQYGLQCLELNTGFASRVTLAGGRVTDRAARQLEPADQACLDLTLVAWVRWVEARGPAGLVDLPEVEALAQRARVLSRSYVGPWSLAMVSLLPDGPLERDLDATRVLLDEASARAPEQAWVALDLITYQQVLEEDGHQAYQALERFERRHPPETDGEWRYENDAARAEAARRLADFDDLLRRRWKSP